MKFNLFKKTSLANLLWLNALFIVAIFIGLGFFTNASIQDIAHSTNKLYKHPYSVSNAVRDIQHQVANINLHMQNTVLQENTQSITQMVQTISQFDVQINDAFAIIFKEYLGNKTDIEKIKTSLKKWSASRSHTIQLMQQDFSSQAIKQSLSNDHILVKNLEDQLQHVLNFANNKALVFLTRAQQEQTNLSQTLWFIIASLTLFIIVSSWLLIKHIAPPIQEISMAISHLAKGNINFDWKPEQRNDEIGKIEKCLYDLKTATIYMSNHAHNISKGYYNLDIKVRSDQDVLGQSMATMSKHLKSTSFINEGMIGLNNIIIGDQTVQELAKNILHYFCQLTQSSVGCFYLVNNGTINCLSTYATPLGAKQQAPFPIGEGVVGEAALQKKGLSYTDLNPDYFKIESATGSMPLSVVQVIPILHNNETIVLFEFGRTSELKDIYHHLFQTASVTITATIQTALNHAKLINEPSQ